MIDIEKPCPSCGAYTFYSVDGCKTFYCAECDDTLRDPDPPNNSVTIYAHLSKFTGGLCMWGVNHKTKMDFPAEGVSVKIREDDAA